MDDKLIKQIRKTCWSALILFVVYFGVQILTYLVDKH